MILTTSNKNQIGLNLIRDKSECNLTTRNPDDHNFKNNDKRLSIENKTNIQSNIIKNPANLKMNAFSKKNIDILLT